MTVSDTTMLGRSEPTVAKPETARKNKTRREPPYHVVLIDDSDHTFDYVIEMLQKIFGYPREKGFLMAAEVHATGRVILATVHKELAALRQEQIHNFGADPRIPRCKGSMTAIIEPAEG
jgi:ATP-dependent Clp protease adaptor protein ClpS